MRETGTARAKKKKKYIKIKKIEKREMKVLWSEFVGVIIGRILQAELKGVSRVGCV